MFDAHVLAGAGGCAGDRSRADWARGSDTPAPAWLEGLAAGGPGEAVTHAHQSRMLTDQALTSAAAIYV